MSTTPLLDILELVAAQTQPHIPVNEAFRTLEVFGQLAVIAIENTPPAVVDGDSYIVGDAPTGAWVGYEQWIAYGVGGGWRYALPRNGWLAFNQTEEIYYRYVGGSSPTSWQPFDLPSADLVGPVLLGRDAGSPAGPAYAINLSPNFDIVAGVLELVTTQGGVLFGGLPGGGGPAAEILLGPGLDLGGGSPGDTLLLDVPELFAVTDADAAPDVAADFILTLDATDGRLKKVLLTNLPPPGIPQNHQAGNYTITAADNGRSIDHLSGDGAGHTYTIPANGTLALPIGFTFSVCNLDSNALSIAITTDTLYLIPGGSTGTRTLAQYGLATFRKVASTIWVCSGPSLA